MNDPERTIVMLRLRLAAARARLGMHRELAKLVCTEYEVDKIMGHSALPDLIEALRNLADIPEPEDAGLAYSSDARQGEEHGMGRMGGTDSGGEEPPSTSG